MSSHSKALQTASELGTSRSALTVKCPPKQPVTAKQIRNDPDRHRLLKREVHVRDHRLQRIRLKSAGM
jgi:hypothetical protein